MTDTKTLTIHHVELDTIRMLKSYAAVNGATMAEMLERMIVSYDPRNDRKSHGFVGVLPAKNETRKLTTTPRGKANA